MADEHKPPDEHNAPDAPEPPDELKAAYEPGARDESKPLDAANTSDDSKQPFYKRAWFVIVAGVPVVSGIVATALALWPVVHPKAAPSAPPVLLRNNQEIVLDRSLRMQEPFVPGSTKLQAAVNSVNNNLRLWGNENLAFREFGGNCNDPSRATDVAFSTESKEAISTKLAQLTPAGDTTLLHAILQAIDDFNLPNEPNSNPVIQIIVISGGVDTCQGSKQPFSIEDVKKKLSVVNQSHKINFKFDTIGVGIERSKAPYFQDLADATAGDLYFVVDGKGLDVVLHDVVQIKPVVRDVERIVAVMNSCLSGLDTVFMDLHNRDAVAADRDLMQERIVLEKSEEPFKDLGRRETRNAAFQQIYTIASDMRSLQRDIAHNAEIRISQTKRNDISGYNTSVDKYRDLSTKYNKDVELAKEQIAQLTASTK